MKLDGDVRIGTDGKVDRVDSKPLREANNRGTRHETTKSAQGYWIARVLGMWNTPFIVYDFPTMALACKALLGVGCIHIAEDSGKLISTESLDFGCFLAENQKFVAMLCGAALSTATYERATRSFKEHGGIPRGVGELPPTTGQHAATVGDPGDCRDDVQLVETLLSGEHTYLVHRACSRSAALEFLETVTVREPLVYVVVETPDGTFGRDRDGIYEEPSPKAK